MGICVGKGIPSFEELIGNSDLFRGARSRSLAKVSSGSFSLNENRSDTSYTSGIGSSHSMRELCKRLEVSETLAGPVQQVIHSVFYIPRYPKRVSVQPSFSTISEDASNSKLTNVLSIENITSSASSGSGTDTENLPGKMIGPKIHCADQMDSDPDDDESWYRLDCID